MIKTKEAIYEKLDAGEAYLLYIDLEKDELYYVINREGKVEFEICKLRGGD